MLGLGYVGLPLAVALAAKFGTTGVDVNAARIAELRQGHDRTGEVSEDRMRASTLRLTDSAADCPPADFYIVTVPTPVDGDNRPDLSIVEAASRTVGACVAVMPTRPRWPGLRSRPISRPSPGLPVS